MGNKPFRIAHSLYGKGQTKISKDDLSQSEVASTGWQVSHMDQQWLMYQKQYYLC